MSKTLPQVGETWLGNYPCCHGPKDGCMAHNPNRQPIAWNPGLPSNVKPVTDNFFKSLFGNKSNADTSSDLSSNHVLLSALPQDSSTCDPLPLVHPSVPYSLSFYHLHALMWHLSSSTADQGLLSAITCHGLSGSRPQITWSVTPKIVGGQFLLEHAYEFRIKLQHGPHDLYSYTKNWFVSEGFKTFAPCTHCTRVFHSVREEVAQGVQTVGVEYSLRNVLGQEFKDEWRSEVGRQPVNMSCGMCYTDFSMRFEAAPRAIIVRFWAHKDLGRAGLGGSGSLVKALEDERWNAARGGQATQRPKNDFGRIRRAFMSAQDVTQAALTEQSAAKQEEAQQERREGWEENMGEKGPPPPYRA